MGEATPGLSTLDTEAKRALLAELLAKRLATTGSEGPLTHGQQAMWFLHQLAPESGTYNVVFTARLRAAVNVEALRRSFQALVDRHAPLRTTFSTRDGRPIQIIHPMCEVILATIDASGWAEETLHHEVRGASQIPFDLEQGPVFRTALFTRAVDDHVLLLTAHHIALDGWSLWVLLDELGMLYAAECAGTAAALPPLAAQYSDYVRWQNQLVAGPEGDRLWHYWQQQLAGELPTLDLPTDHPRPPAQTYCGRSLAFELGDALSERIRTLAKSERTTVYTVLLAAYQVLLHRYSGQDDVVVGSPVAGRSRPEFAGLVGDFVNMVVLRANLAGAPPFRAFLVQVRETALAAFAHQDFPFPLLVERLAPRPDPSRSPIFQAVINLQNIQRANVLADLFVPGKERVRIEAGGLLLEPYPLSQQEGQLDLTLQIIDAGGTLFGAFKYNTDLFDTATIEHLAGHYRALLEAIVADPDQPISTLPLLDAGERQRILAEWNATAEEYPGHLAFHQLVEAQVDRTPEAPAVGRGTDQLSYATLDRSANQLAHYLRRLGIGRGSIVGISLERTPQMLVALLGILKTGAAYLPLDPGYPTERLAYMLDDSAAVALLTTSELIPAAFSADLRVLCLDELTDALDREPSDRIRPVSDPDDLAYLIYTSGSTGRPKGVAVPHRAVVNFLGTMQRRPGLRADDVLVAVTTLAFDIAVLELFLPLSVGARIILADRDTARNGQALLALLRESGATVLQATPATFRMLLQGGLREARGLRCLCGGEPLPPDLARGLLDAGAELWNMYGPTETTVWSVVQRVERADPTIPVGRPIGNTQAYILDGALQPLPPGAVGELYIGGDGMARGYHNRPELTTERFIPNPFATSPGTKLYRTGDLARYRPDGAIVVLGRKDHQVKLRGFRIELGEIEAALEAHSAVREAIVVVREDCPGDRRLVAYLTSPGATVPAPGELRAALRRQLPDYMIPSVFVPLPELPRTPNGKLDRRSLPEPAGLQSNEAIAFVAPSSHAEQVVAEVWCAVLGLTRVGALDNFFDLGGHSLQLMEAVAAIEQRLGVRPNPVLLQTQTLGQLAASCDDLLSRSIVRKPQPVPSLSGKVLGAMRRIIGNK